MKKIFMLLSFICITCMAWGQNVNELIRKAQNGNAEAQFKLGNAYASGTLGLKKNEREAAKWYLKAAEKGYAEAQFQLGHAFKYGWYGLEKNESEAVKWYLKAAEQGYAEAQFRLGMAYQVGMYGLEKNESEAAKWFLKAAEQGHAGAQDNIGSCYNFGHGVPMDEEKAEYWYRKSATQGCRSAYFSLGLFYKDTNKQEAIYWFKKCMDDHYKEYGKEDELASEQLRELGVYYHPDEQSSSSTVSSSSSSSRTSSSSSTASGNSNKGLLYRGTYTQSSQGYCQETGQYTDAIGPGFVLSVEIYDSYIVVNGLRCEYVSISGSWKTYKGNDMFGTTQYYKVNYSNFDMSSYAVSSNPYTGGYNTFVYQMKKGEASFDVHRNNTTTNGGGYSTGGSRGSGTNRGSSTTTYKRDCHLCHGSGKCSTCNGRHRYLNPLTNKYITCPNCGTDGHCRACNGTGKK